MCIVLLFTDINLPCGFASTETVIDVDNPEYCMVRLCDWCRITLNTAGWDCVIDVEYPEYCMVRLCDWCRISRILHGETVWLMSISLNNEWRDCVIEIFILLVFTVVAEIHTYANIPPKNSEIKSTSDVEERHGTMEVREAQHGNESGDHEKELDESVTQSQPSGNTVGEKETKYTLYFLCMTHTSVQHIDKLCRDGSLKASFDDIFTLLLNNGQTSVIRVLDWPVVDHNRCVSFYLSSIGEYLLTQ